MCKTCGKVKNGDFKAKTGVFAGGLPDLGWIGRGLKTCVKWLKRPVWKRSVRVSTGWSHCPPHQLPLIDSSKINELRTYDPAKETPTAAVEGSHSKADPIGGLLGEIQLQMKREADKEEWGNTVAAMGVGYFNPNEF